MNRRGFLRGCMTGVATVAVGLRLAHGKPSISSRGSDYTWGEANARYQFGIDKQHPWDVIIWDNEMELPIPPLELERRGRPGAYTEPRSPLTPPEPFQKGEMCAPVEPWGAETMHFSLKDANAHRAAMAQGANEYNDPVDQAYEAVAIVAMSQGMIGVNSAGRPGFDGPWKEITDEISLPRIITTNEEWARELNAS